MIPAPSGAVRRPRARPTLQRDALESRCGPALYDLSSEQLVSLFEVVQKTHERRCDEDETAARDAATTPRFSDFSGRYPCASGAIPCVAPGKRNGSR